MQIVKLITSITTASVPIGLQQRGALISQGGTNLTPGTYTLVSQSPLPSTLFTAPLALSALAWATGTVTATTVNPIAGLITGDTFITTITGAAPVAYNGTVVATVTGASTFTYSLTNSPGTEAVAGTYTPPGFGELVAMGNSFFGQSTAQGVYVLELGPTDGTTGPAALQTFIQNNPGQFYAYLTPRGWDGSAAYLALLAQYENPGSMTYFFTTTTVNTYQAYVAAMKDVVPFVEAPGLALSAFDLAADFNGILSYNPTPTNKMTPNGLKFLFGVTPYPTKGNANLLAALDTANISYVMTGAQGGLPSTNVLANGDTADGNDFTWWYSADYIQLYITQDCAGAILRGANNQLNPLYYNQDGIDTLQDVAAARIQTAISSGLATGTVTKTTLDPVTFSQNLANGVYAGQNVVNAVPFTTYVAANQNDYGNRVYNGLQVVYIPQNSFKQVTFVVNITQLIGSV